MPDAWRDGSAGFFYDTLPMSVEWAKSRCRDCPVIDQCLRYALDHNEIYGVWGGMAAAWGSGGDPFDSTTFRRTA
nr:WhiB family transcriptional regulator [Bifidobacterium callitrichos]